MFILYHRTAFPEPSDYTDPLADASGCARDIPYLKQLGINTLRVYSVDASENHDDCMSALSAAGIYTMCALFLLIFSVRNIALTGSHKISALRQSIFVRVVTWPTQVSTCPSP